MRCISTFGLLCVCFWSSGQSRPNSVNKLATSKYAGTYSFGANIEKGRVGSIIIYPETDNTILFYIDINRGAPSYNMGSLYGRVAIKNGVGTFYTKFDYADMGCKWGLKFSKNTLTIATIDNQYECGFGGNVFADGDYILKSNKAVDHFETMEGQKFFFKTTKPEEFNKTDN